MKRAAADRLCDLLLWAWFALCLVAMVGACSGAEPLISDDVGSIYIARYNEWVSFDWKMVGEVPIPDWHDPEMQHRTMYVFWAERPNAEGKLVWQCIDYEVINNATLLFDRETDKWCLTWNDCNCWRTVRAPIVTGGTCRKCPTDYRRGRPRGPEWFENCVGLTEVEK